MKKLPSREHLKSGATALGGMIVGAVVGIAVQVGIESTGMLGPTVDALLLEQQGNFDAVYSRLDTLRAATDDPDVSRELTQLAALLQEQDELRQKANSELAFLQKQVVSLKEQGLAERGYAGGADFWLKTGESVSVGDRQYVFGVVRMWDKVVDVNLNGKKSRLKVGDSVITDRCTVFFRQGELRADGRMGFDLTCA